MCVRMDQSMIVCGGLFIWLPLLFLSLFVTSTVQFSEWENLDCILSGLYGLLHLFFWGFVCVSTDVHLRVFVELLSSRPLNKCPPFN